ncbi:hypothetical protein, partial [Acinetobacter baumannii]|uniref:hypothetical protein n=1 Tax=Acinetobacter baumannii TaxID=470 RepID=UPI001C07A8C5
KIKNASAMRFSSSLAGLMSKSEFNGYKSLHFLKHFTWVLTRVLKIGHFRHNAVQNAVYRFNQQQLDENGCYSNVLIGSKPQQPSV